MNKTAKPLRKPDLLWREVDGEVVILSPDNKHLQVFNNVGSRIWALLDGNRDVAAIASVISAEYQEQCEIVEQDMLEYLEQLKRLDLVEE